MNIIQILNIVEISCVVQLRQIYNLKRISHTKIYMSERFLLNVNSIIFQLYHPRNNCQLLASCIFTVIAPWKNTSWVDMLLHSDTLSWLRANKALFLLLNDWLIDWCLMPTLAIFQLYRGMLLLLNTECFEQKHQRPI
jgi:hypothetical protein